MIAHGENWEVAASHEVNNLIKRIVEEQVAKKGQPRPSGTFNLHYKPANENERSITIPLSHPPTISNHYPMNNLQHTEKQDSYFEKVDHA